MALLRNKAVQTRTGYDALLAGSSVSSTSTSATFSFPGTRGDPEEAALVMCFGSTAASARTISSVTVAFDGGSPVTATELVSSGSATYTQGIYYIDMSECITDFTIEVTFSGSMLGCAGAIYTFGYFPGGGAAAYTENVTTGDPIASASRAQNENEVMVAVCGNQVTSVTDIDWTYLTFSSEGNDVTYGSRMISAHVWVPGENGVGTSTVSADYNASPTNPRLCVAYIT